MPVQFAKNYLNLDIEEFSTTNDLKGFMRDYKTTSLISDDIESSYTRTFEGDYTLYAEYDFVISFSRTGATYRSSPDSFLAALARIGGLFMLIKLLSMSMSLIHEAMFI